MNEIPFEGFNKIPRLSRDCVITEKIDGTNAQIYIGEDGTFKTGSRNRWITPLDDNYGFSTWAHERRDEIVEALGVGRHFGEWWGQGIQRRYGLDEKRFSLFNSARWSQIKEGNPDFPEFIHVVPVLFSGPFSDVAVDYTLQELHFKGSAAAPGFMDPEGIIVFHNASRQNFKKTLDANDVSKFDA